MNPTKTFEQQVEEFTKRGAARCPHCDCLFDNEFLSNNELITYYGSENGPIEVECDNCEGKFKIEEQVVRTFDATTID